MNLLLIFTILFGTYMVLFLLYLNFKFTYNSDLQGVEDKFLGRAVPFVVFVQNKQLYEDAAADGLDFNEESSCHDKLRERASSHEQIYQ